MERTSPPARQVETEEDRKDLRFEILSAFRGDTQAPMLRNVQQRTGFTEQEVIAGFQELADEGAFAYDAGEHGFAWLSPVGQELFESYYKT